MEKNANLNIITYRQFIRTLTFKKLILNLSMLCFVSTIVSCSKDDDIATTPIVSDNNISFCGMVVDSPLLPKVGDTRTYQATYDVGDANAEVIWGVGDSIGLGIPFIKKENLEDFGVRIISESNTEDIFKLEFIKGYKGGFVGYKFLLDNDTLCSVSMGQIIESKNGLLR